jgi:hypothetical protein
MRNSTNPIAKLASLVLVAVVTLSVGATASHAQFSSAVVLLKGTVRSDNGTPVSVKVSVRNLADTAVEVTSSNSNASSGTYLVVLKPGNKYAVRVEGSSSQPTVAVIETPSTNRTMQMNQDFTVVTLLGSATGTQTNSLAASVK